MHKAPNKKKNQEVDEDFVGQKFQRVGEAV
jgi:hypothetical protein